MGMLLSGLFLLLDASALAKYHCSIESLASLSGTEEGSVTVLLHETRMTLKVPSEVCSPISLLLSTASCGLKSIKTLPKVMELHYL